MEGAAPQVSCSLMVSSSLTLVCPKGCEELTAPGVVSCPLGPEVAPGLTCVPPPPFASPVLPQQPQRVPLSPRSAASPQSEALEPLFRLLSHVSEV